MKKMKKMMALVIAMVMVLAMGMTVFADTPAADPETPAAADTVSITVHRDTTTYAGEAAADSRNFTWYRVFTATYGSDFTGNSNEDGGYNASTGKPLAPTAPTGDEEHPVAYVASAAVAAKLGSWDATNKTWTKASGNSWFKLTPIAGSDPATYNVSWDNTASDADTVQAAAKWLVANSVYDASGTLDFTGSGSTAAWTKDGLEKGYYVLSSEAGDNLIAATTDVDVKEKNDYPPLDKTQADEDNTTKDDTTRDVAVGDKLDYNVKVTIPKTAKVGDKILVYDKASQGLTYNNDLVATPATDVSDYTGTADSDWTWYKLITVTANNKGTDINFTFSMTVNSNAIVDTDKANESGLKYGRGEGQNPFPYESIPDKVEYKTYFAGIEKVDGQNASIKLEGVKFTLKEGTAEFKVSKPSGKDYYIPDANGSSEVVTAADGTIKIRGLDEDKTYTLTETENPNEGYNMLAEPVTLTLYEDTTGTITYTPATAYDANAEYYTKSGDTYTAATVDQATFEAAAEGTYYTKSESSTSAYDTAAADPDTWTDVQNNKGTILPSTGGIGTTIFYIIGAILVIGAGVLLVTRRRMNAN